MNLLRSDFAKNALLLLSSSALAQAIPLAISPLLTRCYSPQQFGEFGTFLCLMTLFAVLGSGRYDIAIMLPPTEEEASTLANLTIWLCATFSAVAFALLFLFESSIASSLGAKGGWLLWVPAAGFFLATYLTLSCWSNRQRGYRSIASAAVILQVVASAISLGLGLLGLTQQGLVIGRVSGLFAACIFLFFIWWTRRRPSDSCSRSFTKMREAAWDFRRFPMFSVPYSLLGSFSRDFPILALNAFDYSAPSGFFALARTVVLIPISFLSSSLGQIFFKEASECLGTLRFEKLARSLMMLLATLCAPAFVFLAFWGSDLFAMIFGQDWREAGQYASILAPSAFLFLFTSWPERVFDLRQKQHVLLTTQAVFDFLTLGIVWAFLANSAAPRLCVGAFSATNCAFHLAFLVCMFRVTQLPKQLAKELVGVILMRATAFGAAFFVLVWTFDDVRLELGVGASFLLAYYLHWFFRWFPRNPLPE